MQKIISRKGIILIIVPLFAIFLQVFLRVILDKDFNTIGITLGALGLGQILPFFYFDHFIANKILGITPKYDYGDNKLSITYQLSPNVSTKDIDGIKNLFIIAIFLNLSLFLITIYCGLMDYVILHTIFGAVCCVISWFLTVFK